MTDEKTKMIELLQLTLSVTDKLEHLDFELTAAKITLEKVNTKLKYRCMDEDLKDTKKKR